MLPNCVSRTHTCSLCGQCSAAGGGWTRLTLRKAWPQLAKHVQYNQRLPATLPSQTRIKGSQSVHRRLTDEYHPRNVVAMHVQTTYSAVAAHEDMKKAARQGVDRNINLW